MALAGRGIRMDPNVAQGSSRRLKERLAGSKTAEPVGSKVMSHGCVVGTARRAQWRRTYRVDGIPNAFEERLRSYGSLALPTSNRQPNRPDSRIRVKSDAFCVAKRVLVIRVSGPWMGFCRLGASTWREKLVSSQSNHEAVKAIAWRP